MRARGLAILTVLAAGLCTACTPSLQGNGANGAIIRQSQFRPGPESDVATMAAGYCRQFGRSPHLARQEVGWFSFETFTFDCVD